MKLLATFILVLASAVMYVAEAKAVDLSVICNYAESPKLKALVHLENNYGSVYSFNGDIGKLGKNDDVTVHLSFRTELNRHINEIRKASLTITPPSNPTYSASILHLLLLRGKTFKMRVDGGDVDPDTIYCKLKILQP